MSPRILIVDDEPRMGALLEKSLSRDGHDVVALTNPAEALERLKAESFEALITDLRMPGLDGLEVLDRARRISPTTEVILMTAYATVETARDALKRGAVDYLIKPVSAESDLKPLLARLFADKTEAPSSSTAANPKPVSITSVGSLPRSNSPSMQAIYDKVDKIAQSSASVLLRGESGVGKEVLADLIQSRSPRADRPYVKINCGALPENLLESELFGHIKGSFTGAVSDRDGLFATADGGTVMLDEIGEVTPALQVKLLRVLQTGDYARVGDSRTLKCDVRVIAATNRNLERMIDSGDFRQDLYYRLNVVPVRIPPLRERSEDLDDLTAHFCRKFASGRDVTFDPESRQALQSYNWPGNIRELENAIEHALVFGDPSGIKVGDLPAAVQEFRALNENISAGDQVGKASLEEIEQRCLLTALEKTGGNRTRAAKLLGITRRTLGYRLRKYGLEAEVSQRFGNGVDANS